MQVLCITFVNPGGDANYNWGMKVAKVNKKLGMWKKQKLSITGKVLALKVDILPALLHLAYVFPIPQTYRKLIIRETFNFLGGDMNI